MDNKESPEEYVAKVVAADMAFPVDCLPEDGLTKRELMALTLAAAWIQALALRRNEPGYDDGSAAHEANRLALVQADLLLSMLADGQR